MIHVIGQPQAQNPDIPEFDPAEKSSLGPLLLVPDQFQSSAFSFFDSSYAQQKSSLVQDLFQEGYDLFIGIPRGGLYSKGHINQSIERSPQQFFNFDFEDVATNDIPAFVQEIMNFRSQS